MRRALKERLGVKNDYETKAGWIDLALNHWVVFLFSFLALLWNIACIVFGWAEFASRTGGLIVGFGVWMSLTISKHMEWRSEAVLHWIENSSREKYEKIIWQLHSWRPKEGFNDLPEINSSANHDETAKRLDKKAAEIEDPFRLIESFFIIWGTLMWAFGDFLICSFHPFSRGMCQ